MQRRNFLRLGVLTASSGTVALAGCSGTSESDDGGAADDPEEDPARNDNDNTDDGGDYGDSEDGSGNTPDDTGRSVGSPEIAFETSPDPRSLESVKQALEPGENIPNDVHPIESYVWAVSEESAADYFSVPETLTPVSGARVALGRIPKNWINMVTFEQGEETVREASKEEDWVNDKTYSTVLPAEETVYGQADDADEYTAAVYVNAGVPEIFGLSDTGFAEEIAADVLQGNSESLTDTFLFENGKVEKQRRDFMKQGGTEDSLEVLKSVQGLQVEEKDENRFPEASKPYNAQLAYRGEGIEFRGEVDVGGDDGLVVFGEGPGGLYEVEVRT